MLEKEFAAVIRVILDSAGSPAPYYHNIPESFIVPSVFFPSPEIEFKPDTLSSYGSEYILYVNFFHSTTELAYELAMLVYHDIVRRRRLIPLIDSNEKKTGELMRINNINVKKVDECAYQLQLDWISRTPYTCEEAELVELFYINGGKL